MPDDDRFSLELKPCDYGDALQDALSLIQIAHPIVVSAIENHDVSFEDIETYLAAMGTLQEMCGCKGLRTEAFLNEAVASWVEGDVTCR
jgi:hypothetical protein